MRARVVTALLVLGLVAGCSDNSVLNLRTGDCFNFDPSEAELIETAPTVACDGPHDWQVVAEVDAGDPESQPFPGVDALAVLADQCPPPPETEQILYPTADGWDQADDHTILCLASGIAA